MNPMSSRTDKWKPTSLPVPGAAVQAGATAQAQVLRLASSELELCLRLRYRYFVEQRRWVAANSAEPGVERDEYDDHALHMAVLDSKGVAAYVRVLPFNPGVGFMLDRDLSEVLPLEARRALVREQAVEVSRLVVRPDISMILSNCEWPHPLELLFRRFYQESKARAFGRFYIVVEPGWLRLFARRFGLVFQCIGVPYIFPDGTKTVAATTTLEQLEEGMHRYSAIKFAWYEQPE